VSATKIQFNGNQIAFDSQKVAFGCLATPCLDCHSNTTPLELQVTLSGIANGRCSDCTDRNGVFVLSQMFSCEWRYRFPARICLGKLCNLTLDLHLQDLRVAIYKAGSHYYLYVGLTDSPATGYYGWFVDLGTSAPDCSSFNNLNVPYYNSSSCALGELCDTTASACSVTSL
jgi:hypothetical protein